MTNLNNKALERGKDLILEKAYEDAYNKKNREFTYGGRVKKLPTQMREQDIKNLCLALMGRKDISKYSKTLQEVYIDLLSMNLNPTNELETATSTN